MAYALAVNDVGQDLSVNRISLESLDVSWSAPRSFRFVQNVPHTDAAYSVEDAVVLTADGTVRFRGRVKRVELEGVPNAEHVAYTCLGLRELAKDVAVHDPTHGFPRVVFNAPFDDDDYDAARSGKTVGEIIKWLFDEHAAGLRAAAVVAAAPATGYVQGELDDLDVVPPKVVFDSQDFDGAISDLMAFQSGRRFVADPDGQTFHFKKVSALSAKTITYNSSDRPLSAVLRPSTEGRATAVRIYGPMRPVNETVYLSTNGLTKLWNADFEADWSWPRCFDPANDDTYARVFRRFQITDSAKRRIAHTLAEPDALGEDSAAVCPQVYRKTADGAWAWIPSMFDFPNGVILLAQPATVGDEYAEGNAACASDICLVYAYLGDPLSVRVPASGYTGTAYTEPGRPVEVAWLVYDENFVLSEQSAHYEKVAAELLDATKDIVRAGTVRLAKLDWSVADLDARLNFAGQDDDGDPVTTGFESLGAMMLGVTYDLARQRTELALSTDASAFSNGPPGAEARLRELETQARRGERYRALHRCAQAPTPRAGNDGETGAGIGSRGVYSLRRTGDSASLRVAGHVDIEAGDGITITRQVDETHNGFKLAAGKRGEWYWFHASLQYPGTTAPMHAGPMYAALDWYPVLAGKVTKVIAYTPGTLTAGTVTVKVSRRTKTGGAACPETQTNPDDPAAVISAATNIAHGTASTAVPFDDEDVLGLRAITDGAFTPAGGFIELFAAAYFEED